MSESMTDTLPLSGGDLADDAVFAGQPVRVVERDGVRYTLLGTAHVSHASVEAVEKAIDSGRFDAVAVELDPQRLQALTDPDTLARLDLVGGDPQGGGGPWPFPPTSAGWPNNWASNRAPN